jgi:DNA-binding NarL/FixJ family response regulator
MFELLDRRASLAMTRQNISQQHRVVLANSVHFLIKYGNMALRIAIGCCNRLFSEAIKNLLEGEKDMEIVSILNDGGDISKNLHQALKLNLDVIISDFTTFSENLGTVLSLANEYFQDDQMRILLIGDSAMQFVADQQLKELIVRGVVGILPPSGDSDLLKKALRAVCDGELWLDRDTLLKLFAHMRRSASKPSLAKREKEIMAHICQGYRNKEIAQKLNISEQTVKSHCNRIYKKLGVSDRLQLALYAQRIFNTEQH